MQETLITWRSQNKQSMALAATGFAKARRRRQIMIATSSIGPGALNRVTAAGTATVPGDGSLDFEDIVKRCAHCGYKGWFAVTAEQDPKLSPPLEMAQKGHEELLRVMAAAGYQVA